jgi:glycosyltransferase involved in cell wall biosynthesis
MEGSEPTATVVIPTHDRPQLAQRAIASALAQTLPGVEVVVVDDGSSPPFVPATDDPRVRLVRRDAAGGVSSARNAGLAAARGEWVTFLDDDDELAPEMLERSIAAATASDLPGPVAAWSRMEIRDEAGTVHGHCQPGTLTRGEDYLLGGRGDFRAHNSLVVPTAVARAFGGFDERILVFQADDFGLKLNRVASIVAVDDVLYTLRHHDAPRLTQRSATIARDMELTVAAHRDVFARYPTKYGRYLSRLGMYHLQAGHWGAAVRWTLAGLRRDPAVARRWAYFLAAVAGPGALAAQRRARAAVRKLAGPSGVSRRTLARRRAKKYARRALDVPRALVGRPLARVTWAMAGRRAGSAPAGQAPAVLLFSVYRARNAGALAPAVGDAVARGWDVRLWALDEPADPLRAVTVGSGPGAKFPLLNRLVDAVDLDGYDWAIVVDDDVELPPGALSKLLTVAGRAGLDLAQPAHTEGSHRTFPITVRKPLAVARRTSFVEIGPVFAVRRPWLTRVLPFPARHAMGWGLELEWFDLACEGARLGVVDALAVRHVGPVGRGYRWREEHARLAADVEARGLTSFADIQRTLGTWRPWQPVAPWLRAG